VITLVVIRENLFRRNCIILHFKIHLNQVGGHTWYGTLSICTVAYLKKLLCFMKGWQMARLKVFNFLFQNY